MSEQSHNCKKHRGAFLCFGALTVALSIGFGYSMATLRYQEMILQHADLAASERSLLIDSAAMERKSLHNRYVRQLNKKDAELAELRAVINKRNAN